MTSPASPWLSAVVRNYGDVYDEADKPFSCEFLRITRHRNYESQYLARAKRGRSYTDNPRVITSPGSADCFAVALHS